MTSGPILAFDVGGTRLRAALVDRGGVVAALAATTTDARTDGIVGQLVSLAADVRAHAETAPEAAVVGVPGVPDPVTGRVGECPNIPHLSDIDLRERLEAELGLPVVIENDVDLAALGEGHAGEGRGVDDFVFLAVGTGVGLGIVSGGRLLRGHRGAAGEIAALTLGIEELSTTTLEDVAGGAALAAAHRAATASASCSGRDVFAAAASGDGVARALLARQARALGHAVSTVQCLLDPALVVLGGGIGLRADVLADVAAALESAAGSTPRLVHSRLGDRAALIGAARIAP